MRIRRYLKTIWWAVIGVRLRREEHVMLVLEEAATQMVQEERAWKEQAAARIASLESTSSISHLLLWSAAVDQPNGMLDVSKAVMQSFNNACALSINETTTHVRIKARRGH